MLGPARSGVGCRVLVHSCCLVRGCRVCGRWVPSQLGDFGLSAVAAGGCVLTEGLMCCQKHMPWLSPRLASVLRGSLQHGM